MGATLRLFVAVYPPIETARAMLAFVRELKLNDCRQTHASNVHLTLQFIGDTPTKDLDGVTESVERSCSGLAPFELKPERLISLPKRCPRLFAVQTSAPPALLEIQRRLARRLAQHARAKPGDRFLPHLTVARSQKGAHPPETDQPISLDPFVVDEILVMRSILDPSGARHECIVSVPLASS